MASIIKEFAHLQIPLDDILKATNNFANENIIGKGGFGNVYKGKLMRCGGEIINISARRLDRKHGQGDVEFWTEISVVSGFKHYYADYMIGFCDEKGEKIIINRHQAMGSLSMHVSNPGFTWSQRLSVAFDIVEAIKYIHYDVDHRYHVIHRNINSSTILLDDKWKAKLSGFEFSIKHVVHRMNQVYLCEPIGTRGYMDPAVLKSGGVTHKSDIYSFGVVLFELLCGKKAVEDNKLLAPLAKHHYETGTLQDIIHPDLWKQMDPESFRCFSDAAYSCLEEK
uniref:receptor-like protein kinase ANXUR2 n=1 Tax=Erigeron canadensis TaxID=72917 RepID=UPI001CB97351